MSPKKDRYSIALPPNHVRAGESQNRPSREVVAGVPLNLVSTKPAAGQMVIAGVKFTDGVADTRFSRRLIGPGTDRPRHPVPTLARKGNMLNKLHLHLPFRGTRAMSQVMRR